jgi:hypothetical protein
MKEIRVKCLSCKRLYLLDDLNTKISGPYLITECPHCSQIYDDKFLTFLIRQEYEENEDEVNRFEACRRLIALAGLMDKAFGPEDKK